MACRADHDRLLGAARGHYVSGRRPPAVEVLGVADDRLLEGGDAVGWCVAHLTRVDEGGRGEDRIQRRLALWLAAAEVDHRVALGAKNRRHLVELEGGGLTDGLGNQGEAHSGHFPSAVAFCDGPRIIANGCEKIH